MSQRPLPIAPFPEVWDSSMRAALVACPRKLELEYLHHWRSPQKSIHLTGGGAFAAGLEALRRAFWERHLSPKDALAEGVRTLLREWEEPDYEEPGATKTLANFILALADYVVHFGLATDHISPLRTPSGTIAAEFSFALPLDDSLLHPVTGNPILWAGRADLLGYTSDGALWLVDEKTTTQLGQTWQSQWPLRGQFTGYTWAAREIGYPVVGVIARGIGLLKKQTTFAESIQYRPRDMVEDWRVQCVRDIRRAIALWQENYFDRAFDSACSSYSGCGFREVCSSGHPEKLLESLFVKRPWSPLGFMPEEPPL